MRSWLLLLVLLAAVSCHADYISVRTQAYPQSSGGTLYVLGGQQGGQPSMLGSLTRIQLQPLQMQIQGDGVAQAFSSVFTDRRSSLFDSSLSAWLDQQVAALDSLQAALEAAPQMRMPCPRAAAAAQANMPDVMSYLASSRFGPGFFGALAQQEMQDEDADTAVYDDFGDDVGFGGEDADSFDAGGVGDYAGEQWANDFTWEQPELTAEVDGVTADGRGFYASMLAEEDGRPYFFSQDDAPESMLPAVNDGDSPAWVFVLDDGSINWGLIVFLVLACGVLYIWLLFWATLFRIARAHRQRLQAPVAPSKVPLLAEWKGIVAPLAPEKPMAQKAAPEIFESVEIASEQTPKGTFFAPKGNEYVTIAYVPLKGEQ